MIYMVISLQYTEFIPLIPHNTTHHTTQVVISTLPAQAGFTLPVSLLSADSPPVIFDVVYKPAMTKLIAQVS